MSGASVRSSWIVVAFSCAAACGVETGGSEDGDRPGGASDQPSGPSDKNAGAEYIYAHTSSALYRVDPEALTITKVGDFGWSDGPDQMTDIAIDADGAMIGVSFTSVYSIDASSAKAKRLTAGLQGQFNGLSYVPADTIGMTGADVLVATRGSDGMVFRVDPMTGATTQIGNMGAGFRSSGDLVSVANFGTAQTALGNGDGDRLVKLAPQSFGASAIGQHTGYANIWGLAFWKDKLFGFTSAGEFVVIDPMTGVGTLVADDGPQWWGAGVTTTAPVVLL